MESLSRTFHSKKLSNATTTATFSPENAYHGVFSGHRQNFSGASGIDVHDYREIFATSSASSIPVLDLSIFGESVENNDEDLSLKNTRSSKPDYSKIFGGFRGEDDAVSVRIWDPSSTRPTFQDSDDLSHQSSDALKKFNMSYNKISPKNKDGLDGIRHVTQLHPIPGFTCFIDETSPRPNMEAEKRKSSKVDVSLDSSKEGFAKKQPSENQNAVGRKSKPHLGKSFSEDKLLKTFEIGLNHSASLADVDSRKTYSKIPTVINTESCKTDSSESTYFHEELDVNSDAAASAAALRKAIEKAQESIRIAKESVGRKKKGLRSFSSKNVKESSKLDGKMEDVTTSEEQKYKDEMKVSDSSKAFPDLGKNRKYGGTLIFPNFNDGEKLFVAKKVIDEMNDKISESSKESSIQVQSCNKFKDNTIISNPKQFMGESETESRPLDSAAKDEHVSVSSEAVDTEKSDFVHSDQINNVSLDDYEDEIKKTEPTFQDVVKEPESVERAYELEEVGKQEAVRIAQGCEGGESTLKSASFLHEDRENENKDQKVEDEKKESEGSNENDNEKRLNEAFGLLENEKQGDLEQEDIGNVESEEMDRNKNNEASDNGIEEGSQWVESENGSKEDELKTESHKEEETREMFYDVCELEMKDGSQTYENIIEEVEVTLEEMKQETGERNMDGLDEACDHEFDENSSGDDKFQIEDTEAIQGAAELEEGEFFEETSSDQTISDDNEDEREVKYDNLADLGSADTEENDVRSESSSDSVRGVDLCSADTAFGQNEIEENDVRSESSSDTVRGVDLGSADTTFGQNETEENDVRSESSSDTVHGVDLCSANTAFGQNETEENDVRSESYSDTVRGVDLGSADTAFGQNETEENDVPSESSSDTVPGVDLGSADTAFGQNATEENDVRSESSSDTVPGVDLGSADTAFGQNETEENDVPSESSSDTVRGVEEETNESNKEKDTIDKEKECNDILPPHKEMPKVESINEIKASEEPQVSNEKEKTTDVETGRRKEHRRKWHEIDEVAARERERERNRLAVDRAIREARERAFAESRERAERAAVEKATEEVRRRMMADAREKAAKASVASKLSSERIAQSKLRAERAAVERATSEARQRALEKALSQKSVSEAGDIRSSNGISTESAQRSKAKLEKHNRIMERVAKALAEKEKRDLLAQKEQAERNRLSENLDADIKRWSKGKEGNLRALLSTLQYILGPDSGWQAVTLTEIVSSSAVKKAYRKATLCVHPDKLQQRGASVQHKYICEKVFDLLKAAWNRFNSEER